MQSLEERVAYLEGQVSEQSHALLEVRDTVRHLEGRLDAFEQRTLTRFDSLQQATVRLEHGLLRLEQGFLRLDDVQQQMAARMDAFEQRTEIRFDGIDRRFGSLEDKVSRQFVWTVGVQVTTFVGLVAALLSRG